MSLPRIELTSSDSTSLDEVTGPASTLELSTRSRAWQRLGVVCLSLVLAAPLMVRAVSRALPAPAEGASYLPALEATRNRHVPFETERLEALRILQPPWIFIGDSMLGTRIDDTELSTLCNNQTIGMLAHAGSGSAFWYLALKNWVVASGVKPRYVFVFFRDENMTDPMFRVTGGYRWSLDLVAHDQEPELNEVFAAQTGGPWFRLHTTLDRTFEVERVWTWATQSLRRLPATWFARTPDAQEEFEAKVNKLFGLDRLRPIPEADMQKADDARLDFGREVTRSVLPRMIDLADANGFRLVFVRMQRRPNADGPAPESAAMKRYVSDMRAWLTAHHAIFHDDTGRSDLPLSVYEDGDHLAEEYRSAYTKSFRRQFAPLFE